MLWNTLEEVRDGVVGPVRGGGCIESFRGPSIFIAGAFGA